MARTARTLGPLFHAALTAPVAACLISGCIPDITHPPPVPRPPKPVYRYEGLPFAVGKCGNFSPREAKYGSNYYGPVVSPGNMEKYYRLGLHPSYRDGCIELPESRERKSIGKPRKRYAKWGHLVTAKTGDKLHSRELKERAELFRPHIGKSWPELQRLAERADLGNVKPEYFELGRSKMLFGGKGVTRALGTTHVVFLDSVTLIGPRIVVTKANPAYWREKGLDAFDVHSIDWNASDANWKRWLERYKKGGGYRGLSRHGTTLVLTFRRDQWSEWESAAWSREAGRDKMIPENIGPYECDKLSSTGIGSAEKVDYELPGGEKTKAVELYEKYVVRFRHPRLSTTDVYTVVVKLTYLADGSSIPPSVIDSRFAEKPGYGETLREINRQHIYGKVVKTRAGGPLPTAPLRPYMRSAEYTYQWVSTDGCLVWMYTEERFPKEILRAYLEKHPSAHGKKRSP